jgi:hypothetical protein
MFGRSMLCLQYNLAITNKSYCIDASLVRLEFLTILYVFIHQRRSSIVTYEYIQVRVENSA